MGVFQYLIRLPNFMKLSVQSLIKMGEEMCESVIHEKMEKISYKYSPPIPVQQTQQQSTSLFS